MALIINNRNFYLFHDRRKRSCFSGWLNFKALSHLKVLKLKNTVGIRKIIEKRHAILSIPGQPSSS
jgi:hypothetical protein